jgi:hypothetical protein
MTKAIDTRLKDELKEALDRDEDTLLEVVRRFKANGGDQRTAYNTLESIWKDHGFDEDDGGGKDRTRDALEYALELTWGFGPGGSGIWEKALTNE